jgi:hypothetical protein
LEFAKSSGPVHNETGKITDHAAAECNDYRMPISVEVIDTLPQFIADGHAFRFLSSVNGYLINSSRTGLQLGHNFLQVNRSDIRISHNDNMFLRDN